MQMYVEPNEETRVQTRKQLAYIDMVAGVLRVILWNVWSNSAVSSFPDIFPSTIVSWRVSVSFIKNNSYAGMLLSIG